MNSDTFACLRNDYPAGHPFQVASQTLAATTETAIALSNGAAAIIAVPQQTDIRGASTPLDPNANPSFSMDVFGAAGDGRMLAGRPYFTSGTFDNGRPLRIRWVGRGAAAANAGNTLTMRMYQGTSSAVIGTAANIIAATSAIATASAANLNFIMEVTVVWDSTLQILNGEFWYSVYYNATQSYGSRAALSHNTSVTTPAGLSFLPSVQWGNAVGGTIVTSELSMERV